MENERFLKRWLSRRDFLKAAGVSVLGFGALKQLGCGGKDTSGKVAHTLEVTPTAEKHKEGILDAGNWQIAIRGWEESTKYTYPLEGQKQVFISGVARNTSGRVLKTDTLSRKNLQLVLEGDRFKHNYINRYFLFATTDEDEVFYPSLSSELFEDAEKYDFKIPPGFAVPVAIKGFMSDETQNYSLSVEIQSRNFNPNSVRKGEITKDLSLIPDDIQYLNLGEKIEVPELAGVRVTGLSIEEEPTGFEGDIPDTVQYLLVEFENKSAGEILVPYTLDSSVVVFLRNGRIILASFPLGNVVIPAGEKKEIKLETGRMIHGYPNIGGIFPLEGSVVVTTVNNHWAAWKMP